jgi:hypothetical protein
MKNFARFALVAFVPAFVSSCVAENENLPSDFEPAAPTAEHAWLQQLVGEWTVRSSASMGPETDAVTQAWEATETVRSIGGLWVVGEAHATINGESLHTMITLGYDPAKEAFVGTWIDSSQNMLWLYRGQLDETRKILALDAEGPSFEDPTKTASFRDSIEIKSADHRILTSALKNDDGTWTTFMRAEYQRKK